MRPAPRPGAWLRTDVQLSVPALPRPGGAAQQVLSCCCLVPRSGTRRVCPGRTRAGTCSLLLRAPTAWPGPPRDASDVRRACFTQPTVDTGQLISFSHSSRRWAQLSDAELGAGRCPPRPGPPPWLRSSWRPSNPRPPSHPPELLYLSSSLSPLAGSVPRATGLRPTADPSLCPWP